MIIGSGMLATAFSPYYAQSRDVIIYAAGVSNSTCTDLREYERERARLSEALSHYPSADAFVYFGTCSVSDPKAEGSMYVRHKLAMEALVSHHPGHIIARLPQVAGKTPNPHTLLNFLYSHIARSERFTLYQNATRNIIDVDDVVAIVNTLLHDGLARQTTLNIANPVSCPIGQLVSTMEKVLGKPAVMDVVDEGGHYDIDTSLIMPVLTRLHMDFGNSYLERVINKYYGQKQPQ